MGLEAIVFFLVGTFMLAILYLGFRHEEKRLDRRDNANFRQGQDALNRGDLDLALSCANEELRHETKRARGRWLRGEVFHRKRMYKEAIEDYCRAIQLWPKESELYRVRGDSYAALHLYDQAIVDYSDALRLNPADLIAIEHRKVAYAERGVHGDSSPSDLPSEGAITTELPGASDDSPSMKTVDPLHPISTPRPPATTLVLPKAFNPLALTGFVLDLTSIVLYAIGIIPILGIVFSAIGLGRFDPRTQKARWMAGWGLALSILFTIRFLTRH